jgi:twitching motility protein PilT
MAFDKNSFHKLLNFCVEKSVSDVHLREGEIPYLRIKGGLKKISSEVLTPEDMKFFCQLMFDNEGVMAGYSTLKEYDCSYQFGNLCRIRVSFLRFQKKTALILRLISMSIPTLEKLDLPVAIKKMTNIRRGLILVTGVTGSGKSSTMAAMLEEINMTRDEHILTIEDPVEFLFTSKNCRITQREVGDDTHSFQLALRGALRQDPDIIVIGELRDAETIQIAIKAAETGHLVFGTVHTTNAQSTINRVISMFPPEEQNNVKMRLADCLAGTISQRLLPTLDGKGRVCAQEIMINTLGVKDAISGKEPLSSMYLSIELGKRDKVSQSFDQHLTELYLNKKISFEIAMDAASSPSNFERNLEFGSKGNSSDSSSSKSKTVSENNSEKPAGATEIALSLEVRKKA